MAPKIGGITNTMFDQIDNNNDMTLFIDDASVNLIAVEENRHETNQIRNDYMRESVKRWYNLLQNSENKRLSRWINAVGW